MGSVEQFQGQVRAAMWFRGRQSMLIHVRLNAGTEGDYFRYDPKQLRGGQAQGNGFLTKPPTNEWYALFFEHSEFVVLRHTLLVAITRAQSLLIVVGDPEVLGKDELWRTFLNYATLREGWTGKTLGWDPETEVPVPGYEVIPRVGGVVHGESYMDGRSENIHRYLPLFEEADEDRRATSV